MEQLAKIIGDHLALWIIVGFEMTVKHECLKNERNTFLSLAFGLMKITFCLVLPCRLMEEGILGLVMSYE